MQSKKLILVVLRPLVNFILRRKGNFLRQNSKFALVDADVLVRAEDPRADSNFRLLVFHFNLKLPFCDDMIVVAVLLVVLSLWMELLLLLILPRRMDACTKIALWPYLSPSA